MLDIFKCECTINEAFQGISFENTASYKKKHKIGSIEKSRFSEKK